MYKSIDYCDHELNSNGNIAIVRTNVNSTTLSNLQISSWKNFSTTINYSCNYLHHKTYASPEKN